MQKLNQIYRKDYQGEDVVIDRVYKDAKWNPTTEFISKSFSSTPFSNRALVIGNGTSRLDFKLRLILEYKEENSNSWKPALSTKRFSTYGCNAIYRDFRTDFLVATGDGIIDEIADSGVCTNQIVYANNIKLLEYPGKFNLIPQNPQFNSGAIAAYLAAFDGHKKIYLLGFDGNDTPNYNYNVYAGTANYPDLNVTILEDFWVQSMATVMISYPDTEFIRVAPVKSFRTPEMWKYCLNFRTIDFYQFTQEADV